MSKFLTVVALLAVTCGSVTAASLHTTRNPLDTDAANEDRVHKVPDQGPLLSPNYAGYLSVPKYNVQAYYYMVESEGDVTKDPVMLWLTGGPGCSSIIAFYTENGPYLFRHGGKLVRNDFRWTTNTTMIWLDSPAGVGFSYDPSHQKWDDKKTADYNYRALIALFERFPRLKSNKFYLSGESYAGHYVPDLAYQIFIGEDKHLKERMSGWMVGNPCTGEIGCGNPDPTLKPFFQYHGFAPLDPNVSSYPAYYDAYDILVPTCVRDSELYLTKKISPHLDGLRNAVLKGDALPNPPAPYGPCAMNVMTDFLNRPDVKKAIHAKESIVYSPCSRSIEYEFNALGVTHIYNELADKTNWDILVYSGTADSVVNFVQTETVLSGLHRPLKNKEMKPWYVPDLYVPDAVQLGGFYIQWDRISWATVRGAGHMVPQYNPPAGYELHRSFLALGRPGRLPQKV